MQPAGRAMVVTLFLGLSLPRLAGAATTVTREYRYEAARLRLEPAAGGVAVRCEGGLPEYRVGRPDLPVVAERLSLPPDMRLAGVEVERMETEPFAQGVRVAPAPEIRPGLERPGAAAPDPGLFDRAGFQPEIPVSPGLQGCEDGERVAWLLVSPVRWDARSGRLERVSRLVVKIRLEPAADRPLRRARDAAQPSIGRAAVAAAGRGGAAAAPGRAAQPFVPTQIPSLLGSAVDYVIVTDDQLAPAFQTLADWKTASGVPAVVRTLSFIRAGYPQGADDAERIRLFLRDAYTRWGTHWALLGGDTEVIPARYAHHTYDDSELPSDLYYSCLDGNWNANGDSTWADGYSGPSDPGDNADLLPELWVGRAPVVTPADAEGFVAKTLGYETAPVDAAMNQILFFAEVLVPENWNHVSAPMLDGAQLVEQDLLPLLDPVPGLHVARLYENAGDARWRPGALTETRAAVIDSLDRGYNLAVHIGHGYRTVMSCGDDNLDNHDAYALSNGARLANLYAIDCTSSAIDFASLGEAFVRARGGGAVTSIGSTGLDFPSVGRAYQKEYFRLLFQAGVTAVGEAQGRQKLPFVANSYYDGFDRWIQLTLLLLGDPELRIYTATPLALAVTAPGTMPASDSSVTVHVETGGVPLPGARVTAWMPGHEYRIGLTDAGGDLVLPLRPDTVGLCSLTVTAFNARPWRGSVRVVTAGPPALGALAPAILDDQLNGRHGNGDGIPDAGETFDVIVPLRNSGGTPAGDVVGTLSTSDGLVTLVTPAATYGTIAPGGPVSPAAGFRVRLPFDCPDQREIPFTLDLIESGGAHFQQRFQLTVRAPDLAHTGHLESESVGNGDGIPEPGETVSYAFQILNRGTGPATGLSGSIASDDGLSTVLDSTFTLGDLAPGAAGTTTAVRFVPASAAARLTVRIGDADGIRLLRTIDLGFPVAPVALAASGGRGSVHLTWARSGAPDLLGFRIYRAAAATGPFTPVGPVATGRASDATDGALAPLTRYWYRVTAVDSSGNESGPSAAVSAVTNPSVHPGFPVYTRESVSSPVCVAHFPGYPQDLIIGGAVLHRFHPDGTAPVDADGLPATPGDLTTLGSNYAAGASVSDLDGSGTPAIIGATWDSREIEVFDPQGHPRAGFPVGFEDQTWSCVAVGDLDGDGHKEMVFGSRSPLPGLGRELYVFRDSGAEWMDGDANPATVGVFKVMGNDYNDGTPALADLLGSGEKDIVYGSFDGNLYAWRPDGSNVPGFPVFVGATTASAAVGRLDGPANPPSIVIPVLDNTIRVIRADGTPHPGFPIAVPVTGTNRAPSPALADMNGDGLPDIVLAGTDGRIYVVDHGGAPLPPWSSASRFSPLTSEATEASPVVADLDGDGRNDVVVGDENGGLAALSGADGAMLPGFPITVSAEAASTAALCDCDGDGRSEIALVDFGGTLTLWDYDAPFSPAGPPPWPQFHHDAERTGNLDTPVVLGVGPAAAPRSLELGAIAPNPARGPARFSFGLPAAATLDLAVFDLAGRRVRTLERGARAAGTASGAWDLRDDRGLRVASGVYLVRLSAARRTLTRKLVVLH